MGDMHNKRFQRILRRRGPRLHHHPHWKRRARKIRDMGRYRGVMDFRPQRDARSRSIPRRQRSRNTKTSEKDTYRERLRMDFYKFARQLTSIYTPSPSTKSTKSKPQCRSTSPPLPPFPHSSLSPHIRHNSKHRITFETKTTTIAYQINAL